MTYEGRLEKLRQSKQPGIMRKEIGKAGTGHAATKDAERVVGALFLFCLTDWLLLASHII